MNLKLSVNKIREIIDAEFIVQTEIQQLVHSIVIDTRSPTINKNTLFVALSGNKANGNQFIEAFEAKGGSYIITNKRQPNTTLGQFIVSDPLKALQSLAAHHRSQFQIPVIGITGSNGKTTVKEWLYHILKPHFNIVRSPKSYNSQIGVALSVLEMDSRHNLAIFEAGISTSGEMEALENIIKPTIGIFTGIGDAHNAGFPFENPEESKKKEKYKLFKNVNTLIAEQNGAFLLQHDEKAATYSLEQDGKKAVLKGDTSVHFELDQLSSAAFSNASLVLLTATHLKVNLSEVKAGLAHLPSISMRLEKLKGKANTILINDAYSLDEKSLLIGIQHLELHKENKTALVFLAEDENTVTPENSMLNVLNMVRTNLNFEAVVYIGPSAIANNFDFVKNQFPTVEAFLKEPLLIENAALLFTGARNCGLERAVNYYTEQKHITQLTVNLAHLRDNLNAFRSRISKKTAILAMVKAQSYGGGILEMAKFLAREEVDYFGVAYADEGITLRKGGITTPILVMNPEPAAFDQMIEFELEPSIYSSELLDAYISQLILHQKKSIPIHIKLDTGMNRLGFRPNQINELSAIILAQPEVYVKSVFSHLSVADELDEQEYTTKQISVFDATCVKIEAALGYSFIRHLANSAATYFYPNAHFDMVRLGIGMFGLLQNTTSNEFENVLSLNSQISQTRWIKQGESVGYGRSFIAEKTMQVGVIPVGYGDGLRRGLGNGKWQVVIEEKTYPIIGNVCMDMCMVDLGNDEYPVGTNVAIFGVKNTVFEMSAVLETIPYEIISSISNRVQRVYTEE